MSYLLLEYWESLIIASLLLLYWYFTRNFDYWTRQGINGPKPLPFLGNFVALFKPLHESRNEWYQKYGKLYGLFSGHNPVLSVAEPDLIKQILVKDFHIFRNRQKQKVTHPINGKGLASLRDKEWKRVRSLVSPTFTSGKLRKMYHLMRSCAKDFVEVLEDYAIRESEIDLKEMFGNFTMDMIAKCAFATSINSHRDPENPFIRHAKNHFKPRVWKMTLIEIVPKFLLKLFNVTPVNSEESMTFFIDSTKHLIRRRRETKEKYNDLLQLLISAEVDQTKHEIDANESRHSDEDDELQVDKPALGQDTSEKRLTETEILAQAIAFFTAGYETTASTLSFCTYELALNSEIQQALYEEVISASDFEGFIPYNELEKLPLLDAVLLETLRKYPPGLSLTREVSVDYKLANTGITLFKEQTIEIPVYAIHHSEEFYPNPNQFKPERFFPQNRNQLIPYTYLPFGAGPRNCIGMRFALIEAKLCLASLLQKYIFSVGLKTEIPLKFKKSTGLLQSYSVYVRIRQR